MAGKTLPSPQRSPCVTRYRGTNELELEKEWSMSQENLVSIKGEVFFTTFMTTSFRIALVDELKSAKVRPLERDVLL